MPDDKSIDPGFWPHKRQNPTTKKFSDFFMEMYGWECFKIPFTFARCIAVFGKRVRLMTRLAVDAGSSYPNLWDDRQANGVTKVYRLRTESGSPVGHGIANIIRETVGVAETHSRDFTINNFSGDKLKENLNLRNGDSAEKKSIGYFDPYDWSTPLRLLSRAFGCLSIRNIQIGGIHIMKMADLIHIRTLANLMNSLVGFIASDFPKLKLISLLKSIITKYDPRRPEDVINIIAAFYAFLSYFVNEESVASRSERLHEAVDRAAPEFLELSDELRRIHGSAMECVKAYLMGRRGADHKVINKAVDEANRALQEATNLAQNQTEEELDEDEDVE